MAQHSSSLLTFLLDSIDQLSPWFLHLLRLYWLLVAGSACLALLPWRPLAGFRQAVLHSAGRGKIWSTSESGSKSATRNLAWRVQRRFWNWSVPQRWFWHFYALGSIWNALLLLLATWHHLHHSSGEQSSGAANCSRPLAGVLLLGMMQVQVMRRLYETLWVMRYSPKARMHIMGYMFGLSYYLAVSLSLLPHSLPMRMPPVDLWIGSLFKAEPMRGFEPNLGQLGPGYGGTAQLWWCQVAGLFVFLWGSWHQWRCHGILGRLGQKLASARTGYPSSNENPRTAPPAGSRRSSLGVPEYGIPRGDWFELVSCPHYLAEIVIYAGIVIASGVRDPTLGLLLLWVVANLGLAAGPTHEWYRAKFEDYPKHRHALFPYLW